MKYNYDTVALFYDRLARMVYGHAQTDAQSYLVTATPANAHILIAGGGTGWILEEIAKVHPSGLTIDYVDVSAKMISQAERRNAGENKVTFISGAIEEIGHDTAVYDVALTPFLFDNFSEATAQKVFSTIDKLLKPGGLWLYCDFQETGILRHRFLLKSMYLFFGLVSGVEAKRLPDMAHYFSNHGYNAVMQKTYMNGFIVATAYKHIV